MPTLRSNFCDVLFNQTKAGSLIRRGESIEFLYDQDYLDSSTSLPISRLFPLFAIKYTSNKLHPFFKGLCAQGWYREAQLKIDNLDKNDDFTTLAVNGSDLVGAVEIEAKDIQIPEKPKFNLDREINTYSINSGLCLICLDPCKSDYHKSCLTSFFGSAIEPRTALESQDFNIRAYSAVRGSSISGFQVKLGVDFIDGEIVAQSVGGNYILKPEIKNMPTSCQNEHLSMKISQLLLGKKDKVASCALIKLNDGELAYITKRFDRSDIGKIHMEDLSQLQGIDQFDGNYQDIAITIKECCSGSSIPVIEFLNCLMVQFYLGNSDYHLKNIALLDIKRDGNYCRLSPLYDSLNEEALVKELDGFKHEMAFEFFHSDFDTPNYLNNGPSSYQTFKDLYKRLNVSEKVLNRHLSTIEKNHEKVLLLVENSFLPKKEAKIFQDVLEDRFKKLSKR